MGLALVNMAPVWVNTARVLVKNEWEVHSALISLCVDKLSLSGYKWLACKSLNGELLSERAVDP